MKISEFEKYTSYLNKNDLANIFDVTVDKNGFAVYDLNSTISIANVSNLPSDILKTYYPKENETPLLVAWHLYADIRLYWIILKLNNINNAFYKFSAGEPVKYLDQTDLVSILDSILE